MLKAWAYIFPLPPKRSPRSKNLWCLTAKCAWEAHQWWLQAGHWLRSGPRESFERLEQVLSCKNNQTTGESPLVNRPLSRARSQTFASHRNTDVSGHALSARLCYVTVKLIAPGGKPDTSNRVRHVGHPTYCILRSDDSIGSHRCLRIATEAASCWRPGRGTATGETDLTECIVPCYYSSAHVDADNRTKDASILIVNKT